MDGHELSTPPEISFDAWSSQRLPSGVCRQISDIYVDSFPASERVATTALFGSAEKGRSTLCTIRRDDRVVGFSWCAPIAGTGVQVLGYMAVDATHRNQGLGSGLLSFLGEILEADAAHLGLLIEVESDQDGAGQVGSPETRRIRFYKRNGAVDVNCIQDYRIPDLENTQRDIAMKLLWLPRRNTGGAPPRGRLLRTCVWTILTSSYGLSEDHPLVQRVLASIVC